MHRNSGSWNFPYPTMGEGRNQGSESHDPGGSTKPGGGRSKGKSSGARVPGSMDQMGPTQEEDHMGRSMEIAAFRISFLLRSVYDTLPTPTNLHKWGLREDPLCKLCRERGTMAHILSGCKTALAQGRYRWRLANTLELERYK